METCGSPHRGEIVATELYWWQIHLLGRVGPSAQSQRWVHQCVLSCFLSCTSLVNAQLKVWSCSSALNNTVWLPKTILFQCLNYSCSTLKSSTLNRKRSLVTLITLTQVQVTVTSNLRLCCYCRYILNALFYFWLCLCFPCKLFSCDIICSVFLFVVCFFLFIGYLSNLTNKFKFDGKRCRSRKLFIVI